MMLNTLLLKQFPGLASRRVSAVEENQGGKAEASHADTATF